MKLRVVAVEGRVCFADAQIVFIRLEADCTGIWHRPQEPMFAKHFFERRKIAGAQLVLRPRSPQMKQESNFHVPSSQGDSIDGSNLFKKKFFTGS
jgi:hypothetical protein